MNIQKIIHLQATQSTTSCPCSTVDILNIAISERHSRLEKQCAVAFCSVSPYSLDPLYPSTKRFSRCQLTSQLLLQPCFLSSSFVPLLFFSPHCFPLVELVSAAKVKEEATGEKEGRVVWGAEYFWNGTIRNVVWSPLSCTIMFTIFSTWISLPRLFTYLYLFVWVLLTYIVWSVKATWMMYDDGT